MDNIRPTVTVSYAQSIDGSIARVRGEPLRLSSDESMVMTHRLRAEHDGILVGVGTVLADDPRLTVRLVEGETPQIVLLDSRLRCPVGARVMNGRPIIVTTMTADAGREEALEAAGATIVRVGMDETRRVDLQKMLMKLGERNIKSVMVEGGAQTIASFFTAQLVDNVVITIAPLFVGGLNAMDKLQSGAHLIDVTIDQCKDDVIVRGTVRF